MPTVTAEVMLNRSSEDLAVSGTQFWVVKPKLGIVETSHLDTLISGNYIAVIPGKGETQTEFMGVEEPTASIVSPDDLSLVLTTDRLGSISKGVPIYYKEVPVGEVTGYRLAEKADKVLISI
jgi:paraquat-inducible protein B